MIEQSINIESLIENKVYNEYNSEFQKLQGTVLEMKKISSKIEAVEDVVKSNEERSRKIVDEALTEQISKWSEFQK